MHLSLHKGQGQPDIKYACLVTINLSRVYSHNLLMDASYLTSVTPYYTFSPSSPHPDPILMQELVSPNLRPGSFFFMATVTICLKLSGSQQHTFIL